MAIVTARGNKHQVRVKNKLLPKPYFATFDNAEDAWAHGRQIESALAQGFMPVELAAKGIVKAHDPDLPKLVQEYRGNSNALTDSDDELLGTMAKELKGLRVASVTFQWAEAWVKTLKMKSNYAPGTIRKRVGALARVLDWHFRRHSLGDKVAMNPLRLLPKGYSQYTTAEAGELRGRGAAPKTDVKRDYRLGPVEEAAVVTAFAGVRREDRERPLPLDVEFQMLFRLILDTGLRLSEAYRLRVNQVDFVVGVIRVEGSKGARGVLKPRTVPMKRELRKEFGVWCAGRKELVFGYWDGTKEGRGRATSKLSNRFKTVFDYAGLDHLTEHDLRHEACCRWFELRNPKGGWVFSDVEICRIMGWSSMDMALRYASLRGEDLANRLV